MDSHIAKQKVLEEKCESDSVTLEKSAALLQERTALLEAAKDVLSQESEEEEGSLEELRVLVSQSAGKLEMATEATHAHETLNHVVALRKQRQDEDKRCKDENLKERKILDGIVKEAQAKIKDIDKKEWQRRQLSRKRKPSTEQTSDDGVEDEVTPSVTRYQGVRVAAPVASPIAASIAAGLSAVDQTSKEADSFRAQADDFIVACLAVGMTTLQKVDLNTGAGGLIDLEAAAAVHQLCSTVEGDGRSSFIKELMNDVRRGLHKQRYKCL